MSELLALADMAGKTSDEIKDHIASDYSGDGQYSYGTPEQESALRASLDGFNILVAYESVGSWGCDSASFFLLERDGILYENHGGHCSCYGFEGQWEPEVTTKESLQKRGYFSMGGYDNESEQNTASIKAYVEALK